MSRVVQSKEDLTSGRCRWQHGWPSTNGARAQASTGSDRSAKSIIGTLVAADYSSAPFECDCEFYRGQVAGDAGVFATRHHRTRGFATDGKADSRNEVSWRDGAVSRGARPAPGRRDRAPAQD